jgi:mono/diheme cytochrome c family protein
LTAACQGAVEGTTSPSPPSIPVPDGSVVDGVTVPPTGQEIFRAACAPCHGQEGEGTALAYEVRHPVRPFAGWVVRNGRPGPGFPLPMAAYTPGLVSDEQLAEIWDYLGALPQPTTGKELYQDYCANCHGVDARGGSVGKGISDKGGADLLEKVREGAGGANYAARTRYMPKWTNTQLTDQEIDLIARHIATLP